MISSMRRQNTGKLRDGVDPMTLQRILIVAPQLLGDAVLSTVLITALKDLLPECTIDILVHRPLTDIFCHNPAVARVHPFEPSWRKKGLLRTAQPRLALIKSLGPRRYDLLIQSPHTTDGSWGPALIFLLRIRHSVGASGAIHGSPLKRFAWQRLFTHTLPSPHPNQAPRHVAELHLDLLRRIGLYPRPHAQAASLVPGATAADRIAKWLLAHQVAPRGFVLFAPTAGQSARTLPSELCTEFLNFCENRGKAVVITSGMGSRERAYAESLCRGRGDLIHNLGGQLSLAELIALAGVAEIFVGADSGGAHVAAAMGVPTLVCFGPGDERRFAPWQNVQRLLTTSYSCRPCEIDGCGNSGRADCLLAIRPSDLIETFTTLLAAIPPPPSCR